MKRRFKSMLSPLLALALLSGCSPYRFFYYPNRYLYTDPAAHGMPYDLLEIPSLNGKKLSAILFKSDEAPIGTVVHLHGNFGNVSNHYLGSQYLTHYGFDVIVFDYEGYGGSEGKPSPQNTINDGLAVVRYAQAHLRPSAKGVVILGQSLGAAIGTVVAAKEPLVKAAFLEAGFSSYRAIAREKLKQSWITWSLYPFYPLFLGTAYDPIKHIADISPRPIFLVHGDQDKIIPVQMSKDLFDKAKEPKKLWIIEGAGHIEAGAKKGKEYQDAVAKFFTDALQK